MLASLAHQVAFAQKLGLRMVALDRIEALDGTNQAMLLSKAHELTQAGELDHVLLMGVSLSNSVAGMHELPGLVWHDFHLQQTAVAA
jgi:hypothetical protein